jgi:hypothetical protein
MAQPALSVHPVHNSGNEGTRADLAERRQAADDNEHFLSVDLVF